MSNQNAKLPNSYIPNVIKTPATAALNSLKNTANNMFGLGGGNNKGVVGNFVNNTTNRLSNAGAAITNAGTAVANKIGNIGSNLGNVSSNVANKVGNIGTNVASTVLPSNVVNTMESSSIPWGIIVVLILLGATIGLIVYFYDDLKQLINRLRGDSEPVLPAPAPPSAEGNLAPIPMPMQTNTPPQNVDAVPPATAVEKLLPTKKEVFNISSNRFMYEDAAPLCKALGAELATYDQVKEAYDKGADWCNYGWTKGQLALFPTQKETWDKLQAGPEGQRMACGKVGLNGGHFDNPEMRFGVNCYGVKPSQSAHDASTKAKGYPLSPDALEFDRKVAKYRSEADHLDVLPFKEGSWNT